MNNALRLENRIKILKANGKDNSKVVAKLVRQLRAAKSENNK